MAKAHNSYSPYLHQPRQAQSTPPDLPPDRCQSQRESGHRLAPGVPLTSNLAVIFTLNQYRGSTSCNRLPFTGRTTPFLRVMDRTF